jgi:small subunit ribosomal protein S13
MKVRASIKKRSAECKIVRRKGRLYVINIPKNKRGVISLTYIFGIGSSRAKEILANAGVDESIKVQDWTDEQIGAIREQAGTFTIEGELRSETQLNIKRLMDIGCYRGIRHRSGLPLRGQRTKNNSRTRKGKRKTVANKKKATK